MIYTCYKAVKQFKNDRESILIFSLVLTSKYQFCYLRTKSFEVFPNHLIESVIAKCRRKFDLLSRILVDRRNIKMIQVYLNKQISVSNNKLPQAQMVLKQREQTYAT